MTAVTITRPALIAAAAICMSTEETRYYLCGVYIAPHPDGGLVIVATDGHRMFVGWDREGTMQGDPIILSCEKRDWSTFAKATSATITGNDGTPLSVECDTPKGPARFFASAVDGSYPDWRRVIPREKARATAAGFDARYLGDFGKVRKILNGGTFIALTGASNNDPHIVNLGEPDAFGVLMPVRDGRACTTAPEWALA